MTLVEQYIAQNNFGKTLGMDFKIIEPGLVHYFITIKPEHLATPKAAHLLTVNHGSKHICTPPRRDRCGCYYYRHPCGDRRFVAAAQPPCARTISRP